MRENINKVSQRGENLDSLQDKTDNLAVSAQGFRRGANRVRKQMWWKDFKMRICIIVGIILLLVVIIVPSGGWHSCIPSISMAGWLVWWMRRISSAPSLGRLGHVARDILETSYNWLFLVVVLKKWFGQASLSCERTFKHVQAWISTRPFTVSPRSVDDENGWFSRVPVFGSVNFVSDDFWCSLFCFNILNLSCPSSRRKLLWYIALSPLPFGSWLFCVVCFPLAFFNLSPWSVRELLG